MKFGQMLRATLPVLLLLTVAVKAGRHENALKLKKIIFRPTEIIFERKRQTWSIRS